jgi:hypothetical protein
VLTLPGMHHNLSNAVVLLQSRLQHLCNLWDYLLNRHPERSYAFIGSGTEEEYREIEIAQQFLRACLRVIVACSAVNEMQSSRSASPHHPPIHPSLYTGGGIFHQLSRDYFGVPVNSDVDAVMLFLNQPAACELLNVSAWSLYVQSRGKAALIVDYIHCCNLAACIYGSVVGNVTSVSRTRESDAIIRGKRLVLPIGSTCAFSFECSLLPGCTCSMRGGAGILRAGMTVSGACIQPETTVLRCAYVPHEGVTHFELSRPHLLQANQTIHTVLSFTFDAVEALRHQQACFSTLTSQVSFLKDILVANASQQRDELASLPYLEHSNSQGSQCSLLHVARRALVTCISALVDLAPSDQKELAMNLEEEIMKGLHEQIRTEFDEDAFAVLLDISCNAYYRASNGGTGVMLELNEDVVARALSLFNYLDIHDHSNVQFRRDAFIRCLSSSSELFRPTPSLQHERRILEAYTHMCLCPVVPIPNLFGIPLPLGALPESELGPPCVPHSYNAHSCFIILSDLAQYLHAASRHDSVHRVNPNVPRLIIDVFLFRLHAPDAPRAEGFISAADASMLLHAPLSHELCYVGWRLCAWLLCGRLQHQQSVALETDDEMSCGVDEAPSSSASSRSEHAGSISKIIKSLSIGDMNELYWNSCDSSRSGVCSSAALCILRCFALD